MDRNEAEALAQLLDSGPTGNGEATSEVRALAALATAMAAGAARPRAEFKADLRTALIGEARQQSVRPDPLLTRMRMAIDDATARWRYSTRLAAASGAAALALSGGGTAVAAEHALPGDVLYPVKLVLEDARMLFVRSDESRGERHLGYAERRAEEAGVSAESGNQPGAARALREADVSARAGAGELILAFQETTERSLLRTLLVFTMAQRERVEGFVGLLDHEAGEAAADHLVTLDRIQARISVLVGGCPGCPENPGVPPPSEGGFDFARIPPAHESFDPCPCSPPDLPRPGPAPLPDQETPVVPPHDGETPLPPPAPTPDEPPPPQDEEPVLPLPDVIPEPVQDPVDEILQQLLDELPTPEAPTSLPTDLPTSLPLP